MEERNLKEQILNIAESLNQVTQENEFLIEYTKIYYFAMKLLQEVKERKSDGEQVLLEDIYRELSVEIQIQDLNDFTMDAQSVRLNRIIGKLSVRPDYFDDEKQNITVYIDENEKTAMAHYAMAHELCHLLLYLGRKDNTDGENKEFYIDDYSIMPMLPKSRDELVADAFAIFLLIPFDRFLDLFQEYVESARERGAIPIGTEEWLSYLSAVAEIPYYYVAYGYQQIRYVAGVMYGFHKGTKEEREKYTEAYGEEVQALYDMVQDKLTDAVIADLYQ